MADRPVSHKACSCPSCRAGGNKAAFATDAVNDLASENARLLAELAAAQAEIVRLQKLTEGLADRCAGQSELLTARAGKQPAESEATT